MPTRRNFLRLGGTAVVASVFSRYPLAWSQSPTVLTRYDAATPDGKAMLVKLAKAVDAMAKKPEQDPLNWTSWWYTHDVRGDATKTSEIARVFKNLPPQSSQIAERTWGTCQPHHAGDIEDLFLPWHRYFVYSFERVVRAVIGDPNFTLPYWNYLDASSRALPPEFLKPADSVLKALFRPDRRPQVNQGSTIDAGLRISPINLDDLKYDDYSTFCSSLENDLHGTVHVRVGNGRGMGSVPWAANDPIFWLHHCNIDRLWASWNKDGGRNLATQEFLNQSFSFVGPDSALATFRVSDGLSTSQLNYQYSTLEKRPPKRLADTVAAFSSARAPKRVATDIKLGSATTKVTLKPDSGSAAIATFSGAAADSRSIALVFKGLQTNVPPESLYDVFLNLPPNPTSAQEARHFAGRINFFGALVHSDRNRKFVLNVSNLRNILKESAEPTITISPTDTPSAEAKPVIGEITLTALK
ncbi:MAG TPA: tyrosinase family protein [Candidatus Angelobacter sp.]|nr:tyrosinase family protein [Candidatus Angelobacter sp.]